MSTRPFSTEACADPGPRLSQLQATRRPDSDIPGAEVWFSQYGWIAVRRRQTDYVLEFYQVCPCSG